MSCSNVDRRDETRNVTVKERMSMRSFTGRFLASLGTVIVVLALGAASALAATPAWKVFGVTGPTNLPPVTQEVQKVAVDASGGAFTLTFDGDTTGPLAFDVSEQDLEAALEGLPSVAGSGGDLEVGGGPGNAGAQVPYSVRFGGDLAGTDVTQLTADSSGLTGGNAHTATVTTTTAGAPVGRGQIAIYPFNIGAVPTSGMITVTIGPLPDGITTTGPAVGSEVNGGGGADTTNWVCPGGAGLSVVTCTTTRVTREL